jgi:hypothetical protein
LLKQVISLTRLLESKSSLQYSVMFIQSGGFILKYKSNLIAVDGKTKYA